MKTQKLFRSYEQTVPSRSSWPTRVIKATMILNTAVADYKANLKTILSYKALILEKDPTSRYKDKIEERGNHLRQPV